MSMFLGGLSHAESIGAIGLGCTQAQQKLWSVKGKGSKPY